MFGVRLFSPEGRHVMSSRVHADMNVSEQKHPYRPQPQADQKNNQQSHVASGPGRHELVKTKRPTGKDKQG